MIDGDSELAGCLPEVSIQNLPNFCSEKAKHQQRSGRKEVNAFLGELIVGIGAGCCPGCCSDPNMGLFLPFWWWGLNDISKLKVLFPKPKMASGFGSASFTTCISAD